ncbi:unnamed protein product [Trichobilharzia szidati]|nr:unnamed protein product [Trichobilharzia szidati]
MKATKSLTYAVRDTLVSPTLLIRSRSNPSPCLCKCGSCSHEDIYVNVLPDVLFTTKPAKLTAAINKLLERICEQGNKSVHYTNNRMGKIISNVTSDEQCWWKDMFSVQSEVTSSVTPFVRLLNALINFEDFYTKSQTNDLTEIINMCRSCDHKHRPNYKASRLKFSVGLCSYLSCVDIFYWSPGSREIAFEIALAWGKLLTDRYANEEAGVRQGTCRSNLAPQSFGVIENWVEYLSMGKLSSKASRFIQIEPEQPIFSEETNSPLDANIPKLYTTKEIVIVKDPETDPDSNDHYSNNPNIRHNKSITLIINTGESLSAEKQSIMMNTNPELYTLSEVWRSVVDERRKSANTIVYQIDNESLDQVIESLNQFWGNHKCTVCCGEAVSQH